MFRWIKVNSFSRTVSQVFQEGEACDFLYFEPINVGDRFYVIGYEYDNETFWCDMFKNEMDAQQQLFALSSAYHKDQLIYICSTVGDLTNAVRIDRLPDMKPKFFIKLFTCIA